MMGVGGTTPNPKPWSTAGECLIQNMWVNRRGAFHSNQGELMLIENVVKTASQRGVEFPSLSRVHRINSVQDIEKYSDRSAAILVKINKVSSGDINVFAE